MADLIKDMDVYLKGKGLPTSELGFETADGMSSFTPDFETNRVKQEFSSDSAKKRAELLYNDFKSRAAKLEKSNPEAVNTAANGRGLSF